MTLTPVQESETEAQSNSLELLIKEARLEARRRRLRVVLAVLVVIAGAVTIWLVNGGGVGHRLPAPRTDTSIPKRSAPTGSSNAAVPIVLNGQSINRVATFGPSTLWVFTGDEVATSGGGQGVELTTNAGKTWTNVTPAGLGVDGGGRWMGNFTALSATSAWLTYGRIDSGPQIIDATTNAGRTWSRVGVLPANGCELQFVTVKDGTCTVLGGALGSMFVTIDRTSDAGATWHLVYKNRSSTTSSKGSIPFGCDKSINFTSSSKGFALFFCNGGSGAIIEETSNGGLTWWGRNVVQPSSVPEGGGGFSGPPVFSGAHGAIPYVVGRDAEIYVTSDGGQLFHPVYPPGKLKPWSEDLVSPLVWRLTYGKEILGTNDGGRTWFTVSSDTVLQSDDSSKGGQVQFATSGVGWLLENQYDVNSKLLRSTDGGRKWEKVIVPGTKKL
jgi:photosystem II stability/assembly factor-like uncharacterized protein